tara:strand:+ start:2184 stop:3236 length:1053 start_codon:yes stop_codon:yes gene_type:complete
MIAFDQAFDLLKIGEPVDADWFMEEHSDVPGLDQLGSILSNGPGDWTPSVFQQAIMEQMLHPSNQFEVTGAKTPTLYRAQPSSSPFWEKHRPDEPWGEKNAATFRHGRFFSPQLLTAEQYAKYQGQDHKGRPISPIYEYELPVPLDHESVLRVPTTKYGLSRKGGTFSTEGPEVERVAEANNMTLEEAKKAIDAWHSVYMGSTPQSHEQFLDVAQALRNAGYDNVLWPETASQHYFPPSAGSAFGAIDWGAKHEANWTDAGKEAVDKWWEPSRNILMEQLGIPHRDSMQAMGKHSGFPQWAVWNIGDEDTAPQFRRTLGKPNMEGKIRQTDYHNFAEAAAIAARALRGGL